MELRIDKIDLYRFRNWQEVQLNFHPVGNIFIGPNGQGKTNLMEALAYIQQGRSFKQASDRQLVMFQQADFLVQGEMTEETQLNSGHRIHQSRHFTISFDRKTGKTIKLNEQKLQKLSQLVGQVNIVILSLEDRVITQGNPADRRRFLDQALTQIDAEYLIALQETRQLLLQKQQLLKTPSSDSTLGSIINQQLSPRFALLMQRRSQLIEQLAPLFMSFYQRIDEGMESVAIRYKPNLNDSTVEGIYSFLEARAEKEREMMQVLIGPQRDDMEITINKQSSRFFASQGQHKSLIIALKLALAEFYFQYFTRKPILMLDDIFSELDIKRARSLVHLFPHFSQVFITLPREDELALLPSDHRCFYIEKGMIRHVS